MALKEVEVSGGYNEFWSTVKELETEAGRKNVPLVFIVKSTNLPDGTCWCRDCGILDRMLKDKLKSMNLNGILVTGKVGTLEEWLEDDNRFKNDETLRLAQIPTAYRWKNGKILKKLECPDLLNSVKFKSLFT